MFWCLQLLFDSCSQLLGLFLPKKSLCSFSHLRVFLTQFKTRTKGEVVGRSETPAADFSSLWLVNCIAVAKAGSKSTCFPKGGTNSCGDSFSAVNLVTSLFVYLWDLWDAS